MGNRSVTVERFEEIERRLRDGRSLREIARALGCSRKTVREVRDGLRLSPAIPPAVADPLRMSQVPEVAISVIANGEKPTGVGEPAVTVVAPALGNAIFNACGARMRELPITPERVLRALAQPGRAS